MKIKFRTKLLAVFVLGCLSISAFSLYMVYQTFSSVSIEFTRGVLATATGNAVGNFYVSDIKDLTQKVIIAREEAKKQNPKVSFTKSAEFKKLINSPLYKKIDDDLRIIDKAPPHFGISKISDDDRDAKYKPHPKGGTEKILSIFVRTAEPKKVLVIASTQKNLIGSIINFSKNQQVAKPWETAFSAPKIQHKAYHGDDAITAWAPIKDSNNNPVALLESTAPADIVYIFDNWITLGFISIFGWAIPISIVIASWVSKRLNKPIELLSKGMEKVSSGESDASIKNIPQSNDEFELLLENFNRMVEGLSERDMFARWLTLAKDIQQHLLPKGQPQMEGFDIFGNIDYCDQTGGDYLDYIDLEDNKLGKTAIAIGDVTGHGIGAALLMTSARAVLRSHALHHEGSISDLFNDINVHLVRDTGDTRFLTLFYAEIDPASMSFEYASAGHDPALWYHANSNKIQRLNNTGIPLGVIDNFNFEQSQKYQFNPGDILVISTDGIREAKNADKQEFGLDKLENIIKNSSHLGAQELHDKIIEEVKNFQGEIRPDDDITLAVVKCI